MLELSWNEAKLKTKVFSSQGSFPRWVLQTFYRTLTYTPTQLSPGRHTWSLSAETHCPRPFFWRSQHPPTPTATWEPSTSTQEQPLLPRRCILNKAGDVILLGNVASERWLGHTASDSGSWAERLHTESNILPRVRKRKMINKCLPASEMYTLGVWPWVSHLAQIQTH